MTQPGEKSRLLFSTGQSFIALGTNWYLEKITHYCVQSLLRFGSAWDLLFSIAIQRWLLDVRGGWNTTRINYNMFLPGFPGLVQPQEWIIRHSVGTCKIICLFVYHRLHTESSNKTSVSRKERDHRKSFVIVVKWKKIDRKKKISSMSYFRSCVYCRVERHWCAR